MPSYITLSDIFENKCTEDEFNNAFLKAIETVTDKASINIKKREDYSDTADLIHRMDNIKY